MHESKRENEESSSTAMALKAAHRVARMLGRLVFPIVSTVLGCAIAVPGSAQVNVTTFHNDIGRTGQNLNETILTPASVKSGFGKLFSQTVDGQVYAQPLYLSGVTINGAKHNVIFVATENDSVYAFDADTNGGSNSSPLWMASMLNSAHGAGSGAQPVPYLMVGSDIQPIYGITGTPVIDVSTGTLYVVSKSYESSKIYQRLHALDVTTGAEKFGGPVTLQASVPGTGTGSVNGVLNFDPQWENQRPGLLLLNGIVWIGFASHGDNGPWHGWILGYNAKTLQQTGAYCTSPNGAGSGIWMSGGGLAADQLDPVNKPYGRMFIPTGNGDFTATKPYTNSMDYGDSEVVLDLTNGAPTVTDDFTTYMQASFNAEDGDIASGGMLVLPNQSGTYPHLAAQVGKQGWMYVMNRDNMGGYSTTGDSIAQEIQWAVGGTGAWSSAAYWNGNVYWWGKIDALKQFPITNSVLSTNPIKSTETYGFPGATPSISANGNTNGIVWSIDTENNMAGPAILQAHDAANVATTLYSSSNSPNDTAGLAVKFATPTIANGKVYVGAGGEIDVYGLRTTPTVATPVISPGSETYSGALSVTISDTTPGATIYYTTNGAAPTTSSTVYTGPITVAATETITAMASASGYVNSATASATYTNTAAVPVVTFSLPTGTYNAAQSLTLSDSLSSATIYYTTDGTTPTTSSTVYSGPITISSTETITAIATASGMAPSAPLAQSYTIILGATGIQYNTGFASSTGQVILNGSSQLNDTRLQLTDGLANEAGSAFYYQPVSVSSFTTDFTFQLSNPAGEGITFVIQNSAAGSAAIGANGAGLGYAGIPNSLAIKFDLYSDAGEGADSTGLYTGGATPTTPSIDLSSTGINLHSDDLTGVHVTYDGTTLRMTITDQVTGAVWSTSWTIDIPSVIGANSAYVGFSGGTGTATASQKILSWSYYTIPPAAAPAFSPAAGSYSSAQTVTLSDTTSGATIYYTTDGSTPTTGSTRYTGAITVNASETLKAIAVATGYTTSSVASAAYTIQQPAAAPVFSPAGGAYTGTQTVTISDATPGAVIYYTTNGSTPTTSSTRYTTAISVAGSETINAIAVASGYSNSSVASAAYTINSGTATATPSFSPGPANFTGPITVTISDATAGAVIYYTTDGSTPTTASAVYAAHIPVSANMTIQAIAVAPNYSASAVARAVYPILAATPVYSPGAGTYTSTQTVTISDPTPGTTIYYTTDGTTPTTSSNKYTGPVTVSQTEPLLAIATAPGLTSSYLAAGAYYINQTTTATPILSPAGGAYSNAQTVTISDATAGAVIYYTTNGSAPTTASTRYTGAFSVNASETVQAIAVASGYANSAVARATFTMTAAAAGFSPAAGSYSSAQTVTLSSATSGAAIYYTTDGSTPTTSSARYAGPVTVSASETIKAIAVASGYTNSAVTSAVYTISTGTAATPVISPAGGMYSDAQTVTITDATPNATIYYTTNGTTPTTASTLYTGAFRVYGSETVQAIAVSSGYANSAVASAIFTLTVTAPTISPAAGTYTSAQTVTLSDSTISAVIYYTTNGSTPTSNSAVYSGPITVSASETIKAMAGKGGYTSSPVISATYTINSGTATATPSFSPGPANYTGPITVSISDATAGAVIHYTTDGSTPTTSSPIYTSGIPISKTETLQAIAVAPGYSSSTAAAGAYAILAATPSFSPAPGTYTGTQMVTISDKTAGVTIYYTTDGTTPTTSSNKYTGPVAISSTLPLLAIATAPGLSNSYLAAGAYYINSSTASVKPAAGGAFPKPQAATVEQASLDTAMRFMRGKMESGANGEPATTPGAEHAVAQRTPAIDFGAPSIIDLAGDSPIEKDGSELPADAELGSGEESRSLRQSLLP